MLVLSGMVVSALFQSLLSLIKFVLMMKKTAGHNLLVDGSLGSVGLKDRRSPPSVIIFYGRALPLRWKLNVLSWEIAKRSLAHYRAAESADHHFYHRDHLYGGGFCGIIGWVGQVIPHFADDRGPHHKVLIAAMLIGAGYLLMIDNLAAC